MKNNPNKGTKGNDYIARSLQELGAARSIVATADGEVIAGNHVLEQAEKLGIPTRVVQTDGSELVVVQRTDVQSGSDKAMAIAVADNKATELNLEWDEELLSIMADDVGSWTNNDNIFPAHDPSAEVKEDDFDPDAHYETKVKAGEVWQLGDHRLMCGDSTDADAVAKLMNGERADIAFTSPPYNAGDSEMLTNNSHMTTSKYQNSDDNLSNYDELLFKSTQNNIDFAKYAFINIQMLAGNKLVFCDYMGKFKQCLCDILIWNKNNPQPAMARRVMNSQFEFVLIFSKDKPTRAVGTRDFRGDVPNVLNMSAQGNNEFSAIHAATFSVPFAGYFVSTFSNEGEIVLDSFGGTGTTMIACEQLGRKCRMMELDPHYCTVIIARWEKLTGQKAVKLNK